MTMIPSIIRFNNANYNLANRELSEVHNGPFGKHKDAIYKFNNYGRIISMTSCDWNEEQDAIIDIQTVDFIRDIETDDIVGIVFKSPFMKDDTMIEVNFDELALCGNLRVFSNGLLNEYSIFNNEKDILITDGYEEHRVVFDKYGRLSAYHGPTDVFVANYNDFGQLIRTTTNMTNDGYPTTVYYFYDDNNLPVKTITLNNDGTYDNSYVLS